MTKEDMAYIITKSPVWDGASASWLVKHCTKAELKDILDQVEEAENEYYGWW
jgi:hypothetical protein